MNEVDNKNFDLSALYLEHTNNQNFHYDEEQYRVVREINESINCVLQEKKFSSFFKNVFLNRNTKAFYLYGSVGSGKSFVTNLVFKHFPEMDGRKKVRFTFYNLIDELRYQANSIIASNEAYRNAVVHNIIKKKFSGIALLCIDEFHILDITDATMIGEFLKIIFKNNNMVILINSNRHPADLYKDGIHKERFYPIIELIKQNSNIIHLTTKDYRNYLKDFPRNYFVFSKSCLIKNSDDFMQKYLNDNYNKCENHEITIASKRIKFMLNTHFTYKVAYFEFHDLFDEPFYAKNYQTIMNNIELRKVFINNIPKLDGNDDWSKRFIAFVDVAYENSVHLVLSSSFGFEELYTKGKMVFEFSRTLSRINVLCQ